MGIKYSSDVTAKALHFLLTKSQTSHQESLVKHDSKVNGTYARLGLKSETTQILKHSCQDQEEIQHLLHDSWMEVVSPRAAHWSQHEPVPQELCWGFWSWYKLCFNIDIVVTKWIEVSRLQH